MSDSPSFLAISDVHLGLHLYNMPELGADLRRLFTEAWQKAAELGVEYLVIAGDLFDTNKPTPDMIQFVRENVESARLEGVQIVGIAGDHDKVINTESWSKVSCVGRLDAIPQFAGCDYSDNPADIVDYVQGIHNPHLVQWLVFHGQLPELWAFCEDKKRLALTKLSLFSRFPQLKGIILGDIHVPYETYIRDQESERTLFAGYCGSLGVTASSDIGRHRGLLHYDGVKLQRVPFPLGRDFLKIDYTETGIAKFDIAALVEKYQKPPSRRPVFIVEYSRSTKEQLSALKPLYSLGMVRTAMVRRQTDEDGQKVQPVNIRSDIQNGARISAVLKAMVPDNEVRALIENTLTSEDPKVLLDAFRQRYLES